MAFSDNLRGIMSKAGYRAYIESYPCAVPDPVTGQPCGGKGVYRWGPHHFCFKHKSVAQELIRKNPRGRQEKTVKGIGGVTLVYGRPARIQQARRLQERKQLITSIQNT